MIVVPVLHSQASDIAGHAGAGQQASAHYYSWLPLF